MARFKLILVLFFVAEATFAQHSIDKALQKYNSGTIPYISVEQLQAKLEHDENVVLLDTRSLEEYDVSHLKHALWIGYKDFDQSNLTTVVKDADIIVYCSIGVRSEKIGEELKTLGFKNIQNLYGGIFKWVNKGNPVYVNGQPTTNIHTYNKRWEQYIESGNKTN